MNGGVLFFLTILFIALIIGGTVLIAHSSTVVVQANKDNTQHSSTHWVYIALGVCLILIGIVLIYFVIKKGLYDTKKKLQAKVLLYESGEMPTSKNMNLRKAQAQNPNP